MIHHRVCMPASFGEQILRTTTRKELRKLKTHVPTPAVIKLQFMIVVVENKPNYMLMLKHLWHYLTLIRIDKPSQIQSWSSALPGTFSNKNRESNQKRIGTEALGVMHTVWQYHNEQYSEELHWMLGYVGVQPRMPLKEHTMFPYRYSPLNQYK